MIILGIESSCDDTSAALLDCSEQGCFVIKEKTASQLDIHQKYGGVVPELAGRAHAENIIPLIENILKKNKPDTIAVSSGPGLITGLLVGVQTAATLSYLTDIPLKSINHLEGHIYSVELSNQKIKFPAVCLIASGGHTELILMSDHGKYQLLGKTKDDAAGECFDKIAKLIDLPYPGGPEISKLAKKGNPKSIKFPRPMIKEKNYDFSFSGLKTSALYWLRDHPKTKPSDFCASVEQAIIDVLKEKTIKAVKEFNPKSVILAGGVSANEKLRKRLKKELKIDFLIPKIKYAMDNAVMIAIAGYYKKKQTPWSKITANPNWKIYE